MPGCRSSKVKPTHFYGRGLMAAMFLACSDGTWACATCGCALNSDAATGYATTAGFRVNLQYDYIHQNELRSGTRGESGVATGDELEHQTLNRYFTLGVVYSPSSTWRVEAKLPYVVRDHSTFGAYDPTVPLPPLSTSRSSSFGDAKLLVSYQGLLPTRNLGLQLGVKLPTGLSGSAVNFRTGPAAGTPLDASLQPGTGSTDVILGAYYIKAVSQDFDLISLGQFQAAVHSRQTDPGNDYRPGNSTTLSVGLRYVTDPRWVPQLQVNLVRKSADQGALADLADTAGTVAYASPGVTVRVRHDLHAFAFAQLPVYSNLDGNQLFPRYTISVGASYAF